MAAINRDRRSSQHEFVRQQGTKKVRATQTPDSKCPWDRHRKLQSPRLLLFLLLLWSVDSFQLSKTTARIGTSKPKRMTTFLHSQENSENESDLSSLKSLESLLLPASDCKVDRMSGTELAYIGDVVFELYIRSRHVWPSKRTQDLQDTVVAIVRAEHQAKLLEQLKGSFPLTDKEKQVLTRGRNAVTKSKNRRNPAAYQESTSFEAFIGYLYIKDQKRLTEILNWLDDKVDLVEQ